MTTRPAKWFWILALLPVLIGIVAAVWVYVNDREPQQVPRTQQALRQEGFKSALTSFNFSTSAEMRARERILKAAVPQQSSGSWFGNINLMETVDTNSAIVLWKQPSLKLQYRTWPDNKDQMSWESLGRILNTNQALDAACVAAISGPIAFNLNASAGNSILLPHLSVLRNLEQTLGGRALLDLHDGNQAAAWTNLMAATRLVTAWRVEPVEISELIRFENATRAYNVTWQALQTNGWSDEQLARLQREWESANFLSNLPEIEAFKSASDMASYAQDQHEAAGPRPPFKQFAISALQAPQELDSQLRQRWSQGKYVHGGMYEDEKELLLFYRDREIEMSNAVAAPTWMQMRQLPGVTNRISFHPKYPSRLQAVLGIRQMQLNLQSHGISLLGHAAEAEARRRILITAIALERFHKKYGSYPGNLADLTPEFLKAPPPDFIDGRPLRYHPTGDGHFVLYSLGLDCVDHGGSFPARNSEDKLVLRGGPYHPPLPADIVWPLPASPEDIAAQQEQEATEKARRTAALAQQKQAQEKEEANARRVTVEKLLAMKPPFNKTEPTLDGRPLTDILENPGTSGGHKLTLDGLLSLKQFITGREPGIVTFDVPIDYDALKEHGELRLSVDGGMGEEMEDCIRATNGDCLLEWNTGYEPPGQHALQAELFCHGIKGFGQEIRLTGPVAPYYSSNLVQFFAGDSMFNDKGARLYGKLPESNGIFSIELKSPDGRHLKTISGTTSNGIIDVDWNLIDDRGNKYSGNSIHAVYNITLPDSGRSQSLRGP